MRKLSRKERSIADTAELDIQEDVLDDEIIDLVDLVEDTSLAPEGLPEAPKEPAGALKVETSIENLETMVDDLDISLIEDEKLEATLDEELLENLFIITLDKERQMEIIKQIDMASIGMSQACKRI